MANGTIEPEKEPYFDMVGLNEDSSDELYFDLLVNQEIDSDEDSEDLDLNSDVNETLESLVGYVYNEETSEWEYE